MEEEGDVTEGNPIETLIDRDNKTTPSQTFYETIPKNFKPKIGIKVILLR